MKQRVLLYLSHEDDVDVAAYNELQQAPNVDIRVVRGTRVLQDIVNLPFIETEGGQRYFGLNGVKTFISSERNG